MNPIHKAVQSLAISAIVLGLATTAQVSSTYAETYIAGQFGVTLPMVDGGLKSIDVNSSVFLPGTTHSDLELSKSLMYGAKVGHYFNAARWVGVEAEAFYTTPHIEQQVHTFQNPGVPGVLPSATLQGAHLRVLTVAPINVMLRYHKTRLQPYIGVGPGIFFARIRGEGSAPGSSESTSDNVRVGLNAKVGLEFYLTRNLTVFAEWKFNYARFSFGENINLFPFPYGLDTTYQMHLVSGGIGFHF
jgi:opacity protein-like surface antigen